LQNLRLEHSPAAPAAAALSGLSQLTSLTLRSCQLGLQHLAAVGQLTGLLQLALPGNSFVAEKQRLQELAAVAKDPPPTPASREAVVEACTAGTEGNNLHAGGAATSGSTDVCSRSTIEEPLLAQHKTNGSPQQEQQQLQQSAAQQQQQPDSCNARQLSSWLQGLQQLQSLDLSECRLQQGLLDQLPDLTTLTRLQLRRACLDVADPDAASAAGAATQLQRLQLGSGDKEQQRARYSQHVLALGAEAAASCAVVGHMRQLLELDVSHVANACEQLCAGARAGDGLRDLRSINISYTGCTQQQLQQLLVCCPNLRTLNADGNEDLSSAGACDI
jgi:hypothetical protein